MAASSGDADAPLVSRVAHDDSHSCQPSSPGSWSAGVVVLATGSPVPARGTSALLSAHRSYAAAYRTAGPLPEVMTEEVLSETFGLPLAVTEQDGRWSARRRAAAR